jgi:hypothetical protein
MPTRKEKTEQKKLGRKETKRGEKRESWKKKREDKGGRKKEILGMARFRVQKLNNTIVLTLPSRSYIIKEN